MWLLHIATYYYVHEMTAMEKFVDSLPEKVTIHQNRTVSNLIDGSLVDITNEFAKIDVAMTTLDHVAAIFPMSFMFFVFFFDDLQLYTKVMCCNGILAILKGSLDAMTILPDSSGWANCKDRLDQSVPHGTQWMQQNRTHMDLFWLEVTGVNGHRMRWCSDMLLSGHTYFTCLYALGLYEGIRKATRVLKAYHWFKILLILIIVGVACVEQTLEILAVTVDKFHYSIDVYLAVVMTFFLYTNQIPCLIGKAWFQWRTNKGGKIVEKFDAAADVLIPVCCVPFCCWAGRHHTFEESKFKELIATLEEVNAVTKEQKDDITRRCLVGEGVRFREAVKMVVDQGLRGSAIGEGGLGQSLLP
jgi:hypothetical protein